MSNHGFIYGKNLPSVQQIDKDVREIMQKFPEFTVTLHDDTQCWIVEYESLRMCFWYKRFRKVPCLEFRHSYSGMPFMWWIEYEIREQIALKYKLKQYDEGIGKTESEYTNHKTYEEYFRATRDYPDRKISLDISYAIEADPLFAIMPEELHKYIGNRPPKVDVTQKDGKIVFTLKEKP